MNHHNIPTWRTSLSELTEGMKGNKYVIEPVRLYPENSEKLVVVYRSFTEKPLIEFDFDKGIYTESQNQDKCAQDKASTEPKQEIFDYSKAYVYVREDSRGPISENLIRGKILWKSGSAIDVKAVPKLVGKCLKEIKYIEQSSEDDVRYVSRAFKHFLERDGLDLEKSIEDIMHNYMIENGLI